MVTPKQEKFIQGVINGLSQREAFRQAYPNSVKWKDNVVDVKASQLMKNDKVQIRYQELQKKTEDKAIMSSIERKKWLTNIIKDKDERMENRLKSLDILNKMTSEYTENLRLDIKTLPQIEIKRSGE